MLTQEEARELVCRSAFKRRRPNSAFVASRVANRAARLKEGRRLDPEDWVALWDEWRAPMAGGASYFNVTLDTGAPGGATLVLDAGATYSPDDVVSAVLHTSDGVTTGYQIKLWGDVDTGDNANIQTTEGASSWITPTWSSGDATQSVKLSATDGSKTVYGKIRDDVWNETAQLSDTITVDTAVPVITIGTGPDATRISKVSGKRTVSVVWQSNEALQAYKVKVVPATGSIHSAGTEVPSTNGSSNVSGGAVAATTNVTTTIDGRDLELADSGDGSKIIKIFGQDPSGGWSTA